MMMEFSEYAANWRMLDEAEQRENSDNYVTHRFDEQEFRFVRDILAKSWPESTKPQT
jgi:TPR repeat protein